MRYKIELLAISSFITVTVYLSIYLAVCYIKSLSNNLRIRVPFCALACDPLLHRIVGRIEVGRIEVGWIEVGWIRERCFIYSREVW